VSWPSKQGELAGVGALSNNRDGGDDTIAVVRGRRRKPLWSDPRSGGMAAIAGILNAMPSR
jgi:hypothetical protein